MEIDSLLEPASTGHLMNCSFRHFHIGFIFQRQRLLLDTKQQTKQTSAESAETAYDGVAVSAAADVKCNFVEGCAAIVRKQDYEIIVGSSHPMRGETSGLCW